MHLRQSNYAPEIHFGCLFGDSKIGKIYIKQVSVVDQASLTQTNDPQCLTIDLPLAN